MFDNPSAKVKHFIDAMLETGMLPAFACFDVSIVHWVKIYGLTGMYHRLPEDNFVMGVASGVSAGGDLLSSCSGSSCGARSGRPRRLATPTSGLRINARPSGSTPFEAGWKTGFTCLVAAWGRRTRR